MANQVKKEEHVKQPNENKPACFIITPIGEDGSDIRRNTDGIIDECIIPVLQDKYDVEVAHRISDPGSITKQVLKMIYDADLVVANLTGLNPNVMYELAFRHALQKPVIVIAELGTKLPFDIFSERTIFYRNDIHGAMELKIDIKKFSSNIGTESKDNPICDVLRSLGVNKGILKEFNNEQDVKALDYIMDRLDRIERNITKRDTENESQKERSLFTIKILDAVDEKGNIKIPSSFLRQHFIKDMFVTKKDVFMMCQAADNIDRMHVQGFVESLREANYIVKIT